MIAPAGPCKTGSMSSPLRCLVTGASGYIGGRLVPELLSAGYAVRCMARDPGKLSDRPWSGDVEIAVADVMDGSAVRRALEGVDVAYYLIHSLGTDASFERRDRTAAQTFAAAAKAAGVQRIVYLGGIISGPRRETVPAPALPRGGRRHPAGQRRADGRAAGRGDHRQRIGVVRDAPLPHRAPAGHGHPPVGGHPHPADRRPRRAALPGRQRHAAGRRQPPLRHRRPRRAHLRGDDAPVRRRWPGSRRGSS